jgi:RNA polymerase sigma factor (sigma-70 family)
MVKPGDSVMPGGGAFPSTRWSMIRNAGTRGSPSYVTALNSLCLLYWKPVYGYIRVARAGAIEEAKDLTQEFFSGLVEGDFLKRYIPDRGSFRSYLRGAVHLFLLESHRKASAQKRGGNRKFMTLDGEDAGFIDQLCSTPGVSPEEAFEKQWAKSVMDLAVNDLQEELNASGKEAYFAVFRKYHLDRPSDEKISHESVAKEYSLKQTDVNHFLAHCRVRLRELLVDRIRETVDDEKDLSSELMRIISG